MIDVMNYIKDHDVSAKPRLVQGYPHFPGSILLNNSLSSQQDQSEGLPYTLRPHLENLNLGANIGFLGS